MQAKRTTVELVLEDFSPAEAEATTGAGVGWQRDLRRRGIAPSSPGGAHTKWDAAGLGWLLVMKQFSTAGISVKAMSEAAAMAALPIHQHLVDLCLGDSPYAEMFFPRVRVWQQAQQVAAESAEGGLALGGPSSSMVEVSEPFARGRYIVWRDGRLGRADKLTALENDPAMLFVVFDCRAAARVIVERAPRPPMRIEIREIEQ